MAYHRLSASEHQWVFDELIAPSYLSGIVSRDDPRAVYVLGQPGAGKLLAARMVKRAMRPGTTHLVGDDFKASHPDYLRLLEEDPRNAGAAIRADYRAWFAEAEEYVRRHRGDALIEGAPGSVDEFLAGVMPFAANGYPVELVVLAVREADSLLSTALRYARSLQRGGYARFTSRAGHDVCFRALADVVDAAQRHPAVTAVTVIRRDGEALLRQESGGRRASWALAAERMRPYTEQEAVQFLRLHQALRRALPQHRRELDEVAALARPLMPARERPRHNVMVFHGVGGIGKTTLSRKLEAALAGADQRPAQWGAPAWARERILPVRIDLARSAGTSFEDIILTIRAALAELGRPLPAFSIALRRYWEIQHPGESLEEYLRRGGLGARFGRTMPQQMQSALADVAQALLLPGTVGTAVGAVIGSLTGALRERRQSVRALAGCARLADLLEAEADLETLSFYPHLLAWELAQLPADKRIMPVILLDTFEDVGDRTHRDLERLIQRVVWLMPNCFFVITGRSRLQWADPALQGQLDYTGPAAWPGLVLPAAVPAARAARPAHGHGRQVLVGDFSPEDCDDHLAHRLTRNGEPLISEQVRRIITDRSHGLPLYLDLSVMRFLEIRRTGRTPQPADFDHDFPALIARTLSDLTADERHVLRSVSLLDAFDLNLARAAAGLPHEAPALRLIERPFVRENVFGLWPYHLHGLIRSTVRDADDQADDRWSARDWHQAAQRTLTALGEQWTAATSRDRRLLVGCLRQGLTIARDYNLDLDWLTDAAWTYVDDSVWEPITPPVPDSATPGTPADALVELLSTLTRRQHEHRARSRLTAVLEAGLLPADLQEIALYYRAKSLRDTGRTAPSRRDYQQVADQGGRLAPAARRGLAHAARLAGDFPTALAAARNLGWEGRHQRVLGDLYWLQGQPERAAAAYLAGRTEAEQHGKAGEAAHNQALRAFAIALYDPDQATAEIDLAHQLLTGLNLRATTINVRRAELIRDAGSDTVDDRIATLRTELDIAGLASLTPAMELACAFHQAVLDDHPALHATIARLREQTSADDHAYFVDIAQFMADMPVDQASGARWLDSEQDTRSRWRGLIIARQAHLHAGR